MVPTVEVEEVEAVLSLFLVEQSPTMELFVQMVETVVTVEKVEEMPSAQPEPEQLVEMVQ
jgi:hypothetical protein